jgi:hypothetical protein
MTKRPGDCAPISRPTIAIPDSNGPKHQADADAGGGIDAGNADRDRRGEVRHSHRCGHEQKGQHNATLTEQGGHRG